MKRMSALVSIASSALLWPSGNLPGQGIRNAPQDARAMGMGNAFVAKADNASAVYYNPAGISYLESPFSISGNFTIIEPDYRNTTLGFRTIDKEFYLPSVFVTTNLLNDYVSFGYGAFPEFGLETTYSKSSPAAPLSYFSSLKTIDNRFVWALKPPKPYDWLSVGGGFDLLYGKTLSKAVTDFGLLTVGGPTGEMGRARFKADGHAWGWNIGGLVKPHRMHSFGVSFASQMDLDVDGSFKLSGVPAALAPFSEISFPASAEFVLPARITGGYMFKPVEWFKLEFDFTWLRFHTFNNVTIEVEDPTGAVPNQVNNFDFQNTWIWALGTEIGPVKGFSLRGGWAFVETPVPSRAFTSIIPDSNRNVVTAGIGYEYKNISLDVSYAAIFHSARNVENSVGLPFTTINGKWKAFTNQVMMGMSYKF